MDTMNIMFWVTTLIACAGMASGVTAIKVIIDLNTRIEKLETERDAK